MRNVLNKCFIEIKIHICSAISFRHSHRLWDNFEKCGEHWGTTNEVTMWRMRVACWINKATYTYANAHTHAPGYPHAHRSIKNTYDVSTAKIIRERASMLRYRYIAPFFFIYRAFVPYLYEILFVSFLNSMSAFSNFSIWSYTTLQETGPQIQRICLWKWEQELREGHPFRLHNIFDSVTWDIKWPFL